MNAFPLFSCVCIAIGLTSSTVRADDKADFKEKIVGTWVMTGGSAPGTTMTFTKDGKVSLRVKQGGQVGQLMQGTYELDGDTLTLNVAGKSTSSTIKTLDDKKLLAVDDAGVREEFARK